MPLELRSLGPGRALTIVTIGYWVVTAVFDRIRIEPTAMMVGCVALLSLGPRVRALFERLVPYLLFVVAYDAIRYGRDAWLTPERVITCGVRDFERGVTPFGGGSTVGDWLQLHSHPVFDVFFAAPYFVFAYVVLGYAIVLNFVDRPRMSRFLWSFLVANLVAFVVWLAFPVAP
ncbi:MAG TPA: hypothetical protein VIV60_02855, partial [Polyangiaceae bacterium]